jgi:hypothetical protein
LLSSVQIVGIGNTDGSRGPETKLAWSLIAEPGIDPPHTTVYSLDLDGVLLERRDAKGNVAGRWPVPR